MLLSLKDGLELLLYLKLGFAVDSAKGILTEATEDCSW